jgi:cytochrome c peroxidase
MIPDLGVSIPLSTVSREDTGHAVFHSRAGGGLACASCHPEGGEDGRVWQFDPIGQRRTLTVRGGILSLAPYHWDGDLADIPSLAAEVLVKRMSGPVLAPDQLAALEHFVDAIPYLPLSPPADPQSVARGSQLFYDLQNVGCTSCHRGTQLTNHNVTDVGTGGPFKVPSLRGVAWRAPYLHDGRALTLADRFSPLGGGDSHGTTSQLSQAQITDLVNFLESL